MSGKRLLLHICCGPCAIHPLESLLEQGFEVTGLYYNPNIHPLQEYLRRREGVEQVAARLGVTVIFLDKEYDPQRYFREVNLRETSRCMICHGLRLEKTRSVARRGGFDAFSSTLLYSRMQRHEIIRDLGRDMAGGGAPAFLYQDFREGWRHGIETSKAWGIYRQQYCGCLYSEFERYHKELADAAERGEA
jgi:epoxyqueuosine reductase